MSRGMPGPPPAAAASGRAAITCRTRSAEMTASRRLVAETTTSAAASAAGTRPGRWPCLPASRQSPRRARACGWRRQTRGTQPRQVPRRQLGGLARADHQHLAAGRVGPPCARHIHGHRRRRRRTTAQDGLVTSALAGAQRRLEQPVQPGAGGPRRARHRVRLPDLSEDLSVAENGRVKAAGHAQQVLGRCRPSERVGCVRLERHRPARDGSLPSVVGDDVHLHPIAGGQERHFAQAVDFDRSRASWRGRPPAPGPALAVVRDPGCDG